MRGKVTGGAGDAAEFVSLISDLVVEELGFQPYPGTLNIADATGVTRLPERSVSDPSLGTDGCRGVIFRPCLVGNVRGAVVEPIIDGYPADKSEVIAPVHLRTVFGFEDGDDIQVTGPSDEANMYSESVNVVDLCEFEKVVLDTDRLLAEMYVGVPTATKASGTDRTVPALRHFLQAAHDLDCQVSVHRNGTFVPVGELLGDIESREDVSTITGGDTGLDSEGLRRYVASIDSPPGNVVLVGTDRPDRSIAHDVETSYLNVGQFDPAPPAGHSE